MIQPTEKIWRNGEFIPWDEARVHIMTHALHYGTSVFEGIRCYATSSGPAIFRGKEHIRRLFDSAKIYRMADLGFDRQQIVDALPELVRVNGLQSCYLRPITFRGYGDVGVLSTNNPMEMYIVLLGVGPVPRGPTHSKKASTSASHHGHGWLPTRYRPWPR